MKVKWIEYNKYYTYKTCYSKSKINVGFNLETQDMEYDCISEKTERYKKEIKEGNISYYSIFKNWKFYSWNKCIEKAINLKYNCCVHELLTS